LFDKRYGYFDVGLGFTPGRLYLLCFAGRLGTERLLAKKFGGKAIGKNL
jgi:hypothetical protein